MNIDMKCLLHDVFIRYALHVFALVACAVSFGAVTYSFAMKFEPSWWTFPMVGDVYRGMTMILQWVFFSSPFKYNSDSLFFIVIFY
jgi:hypothetical protein